MRCTIALYERIQAFLKTLEVPPKVFAYLFLANYGSTKNPPTILSVVRFLTSIEFRLRYRKSFGGISSEEQVKNLWGEALDSSPTKQMELFVMRFPFWFWSDLFRQ